MVPGIPAVDASRLAGSLVRASILPRLKLAPSLAPGLSQEQGATARSLEEVTLVEISEQFPTIGTNYVMPVRF
jgi:hypothetical protein